MFMNVATALCALFFFQLVWLQFRHIDSILLAILMCLGAEFSTQMESKIPYLVNPLGQSQGYTWYVTYAVVYLYILINRKSQDYSTIHTVFLVIVAAYTFKHSFGPNLNLKRNYEKIQ